MAKIAAKEQYVGGVLSVAEKILENQNGQQQQSPGEEQPQTQDLLQPITLPEDAEENERLIAERHNGVVSFAQQQQAQNQEPRSKKTRTIERVAPLVKPRAGTTRI